MLTSRLFANKGVTIESDDEQGFDVKGTKYSYNDPVAARFRIDRVYDKDNKKIGGLTFSCVTTNKSTSVSQISAANYKEGGAEVNSILAVQADSEGRCFVTGPMRVEPGTTDVVNKGYLDGRLSTKQDKLTFATEEEAIGGTNNTTLMSPLRVDQAFDEKFKVIDGNLNVFENGEWVKYVPK